MGELLQSQHVFCIKRIYGQLLVSTRLTKVIVHEDGTSGGYSRSFKEIVRVIMSEFCKPNKTWYLTANIFFQDTFQNKTN